MLPDARATAEALGEVVEAAGGRLEVYVDGGFTQGHDVLEGAGPGGQGGPCRPRRLLGAARRRAAWSSWCCG